MAQRLVLIDNYDSFTYNLYQLIRSSGGPETTVIRNDETSPEELDRISPSGLVISPGPGKPAGSGVSSRAVEKFIGSAPILGICLGMQCINEVFGGRTVPAPVPCHGKRDRITHGGKGIFEGIPSPFTAARYHSLITDVESPELEITARNGDGCPMALSHVKLPVFGLQFHPESFMTDYGGVMMENFLKCL